MIMFAFYLDKSRKSLPILASFMISPLSKTAAFVDVIVGFDVDDPRANEGEIFLVAQVIDGKFLVRP